MPIRSAFGDAARDAARDLRRLPSEARKIVGREVQDQVAEPLAESVRAEYRSGSAMAQPLAGAVKTRVNAEPVIVVGGSRKLVSGGANARQLVYGVEFGSGDHGTHVGSRRERLARQRQYGFGTRRGSRTRGTTVQFTGPGEHHLFGTFSRQAEQTFTRWLGVLETVLDGWGAQGGR